MRVFGSSNAPAPLLKTARFVFDMVCPERCIGCSRFDTMLCGDCTASIRLDIRNQCAFCGAFSRFGKTCTRCSRTHRLKGVVSFYPYAHPCIHAALHAWKYENARSLEAPLTQLFKAGMGHIEAHASLTYELFGQPPFLIIPMPLHKRKERARGFNQAHVLAQAISHPITPLLHKRHSSFPQATLRNRDRMINIANTFAVSPFEDSAGAHCVIIDDVATTGLTGEHAARALVDAGAQSVWEITLAYGHPRRSNRRS